jgi:cell division protein FtsB
MESHQHALREIKETKEKNGELELENRILGNKISSLEDDIKVNYLNIEKMHQNNAELENGISELTKYK